MPRYIANNFDQTTQNQEETQQEVMNQSTVQPAAQVSEDPYAHMFADWDLVPPQLVIRRIHRNH